MSDNEQDPGASTEKFRAYVADRQEAQHQQRNPAQSPVVLLAAGVLALAAALVIWVFLR